MLKAKDLMNPNPPSCGPDTPLEEIAKRFAQDGITGMLVLDDKGALLGIITESDLIDQQRRLHLPTAIAIFDMVIPLGEERFEHELARLQAMTAADLMSRNVESVPPDADLETVATIMADEKIHHLPVVEGGRVIGMIAKHDVIKALVEKQRARG